MLSFITVLAQENPCHTGCDTYHQFRGIAAVTVAVICLIGFPAFVLATNIGYRKGAAVVLACEFGYLTIHGFLWLIYPRGPIVNRKILGLPQAISSRVPAILLMLGAGTLCTVLCLVLNLIDRPQVEEPLINE